MTLYILWNTVGLYPVGVSCGHNFIYCGQHIVTCPVGHMLWSASNVLWITYPVECILWGSYMKYPVDNKRTCLFSTGYKMLPTRCAPRDNRQRYLKTLREHLTYPVGYILWGVYGTTDYAD